MIKSITITNHLNESVVIELRDPEKSGFYIKSIEGLGPVKSDINMRDMVNIDGGFFESARADKRNIVFTIGFFRILQYPEEGGRGYIRDITIEQLRRLSYKYFPLKRKIRIDIETDELNVYTEGYVESNEPNIFSRDEEAIISVICPESYFRGALQIETAFSSVTPVFQFPFSNESTTQKLLNFGTINYDTIKNVVYEGETPTGMLISIHCIGAATNIEITSGRTLGSIYIDTTKLAAIVGSGIQDGDDIFISTVKGNKYATLVRSGTTYNILNAVINNIEWFEIEPGDNEFTYDAATGITNLQFTMTFNVLYQGV